MRFTLVLTFILLAGCGSSGPDTCTATSPEVASKQKVTFTFSGSTASYVIVGKCYRTSADPQVQATYGALPCELPEITDLVHQPVSTAPGAPQQCEAVASPGLYTRALPVGTKLELTWDGRAYASYSACVDCGEHGGIRTFTRHAPKPISAGKYSAHFRVLDDPGHDCGGGTSSDTQCFRSEQDPFDCSCWTERYADAAFNLPDGGNVSVPVALSPP
jgi:hypothetical protein